MGVTGVLYFQLLCRRCFTSQGLHPIESLSVPAPVPRPTQAPAPEPDPVMVPVPVPAPGLAGVSAQVPVLAPGPVLTLTGL